MDDNLVRREAGRPRRASTATELGANVSPQDAEIIEIHPDRESQTGAGKLSAAGRRMDRSNSAPQGVYQRHMPMAPLKFPIPRKTKEKRGGLVCFVHFSKIMIKQRKVTYIYLLLHFQLFNILYVSTVTLKFSFPFTFESSGKGPFIGQLNKSIADLIYSVTLGVRRILTHIAHCVY